MGIIIIVSDIHNNRILSYTVEKHIVLDYTININNKYKSIFCLRIR